MRLEHGDFEAFLASRIFRRRQPTAVEEMDLVDVGDTDHGEWSVDDDFGPGLFPGFPARGIGRRFAVFHETGWQRPEAKARLYRPSAEKYGAIVLGNAAHDEARIFVVNMAAIRADMPRQIVARGHGERNDGAAEQAVTDHDDSGEWFLHRV